MEIESYYGKKIIAVLGYNPRAVVSEAEDGINNRCYVYPKYLQNEAGVWQPIDPRDFPSTERIDVVISNGQSAEEVVRQLGTFVFVQINVLTEKTTLNPQTRYRAKYNPSYKNQSEIIMSELGSVKLNLFQVIQLNISPKKFCDEKKIENFAEDVYTNTVFVHIADSYYGPFNKDKIGSDLVFTGLQETNDIVGRYEYDRLESFLLEISDVYSTKKTVSFIFRKTLQPGEFIDTFAEEKIDWITDAELINMLISTIKNAPDLDYFKSQVRQIRRAIEESVALEKQTFISEERIERIEELLQNAEMRSGLLEQILNFMLENSNSSDKLLRLLAEDKFDSIKDKLLPMQEIQKRIDEKREELDQIESGIANNRERAIQENKVELDRIRKREEESLASLKAEITALETKKDDLAKWVDIAGDIGNMEEKKRTLSSEITRLQSNYDYQKEQNDKLEYQVKKILEDLNSAAPLTGKLIERKLIDRVLKTVSGEISEEEAGIVPFSKDLLLRDVSSDTIIDYVYNDIQNRANRNVTKNDVINYLLCISQGFITVFAGDPGTGKTSLCSLLAKSLGLARKGSDNRYVEVSVERGWSSHKDYIGYYNPLTKCLEKSNAEIYDAFRLLSEESDFSDNAPFFLLLDEANLSPIEHYWSPFLKLCDRDSCSGNLLVLGGDVKWRIPRHLRFLATVNFDHTTEELSPRFLDRAWIITLEPEMLQMMDMEEEPVLLNENTFDYSSLEAAFAKVSKDVELNKTIAIKWDSIQKKFKDNNIPIMPRNLKMVKNYCFVASALMDTQTEETKFAPIDYAVAQKILPTINGTGENYKRLIEDLLQECENMPISQKHLRRMKEVAERNLGFYQFFAR